MANSIRWLGGLVLSSLFVSALSAQSATKSDAADHQRPSSLLTYSAPMTIEMDIGVKIQPVDGNLVGTLAQTVFPTQWPEQTVTVVDSKVSQGTRVNYRELPGNNRQMLIESPLATPQNPIDATVRVRIEKYHITGPADTTKLRVPKSPGKHLKLYLGSSPYIDPGVAEIKRIVKKINDSDPLTDWKRVELLYDWVRENIEYKNGDLKSVSQALRDRNGDCEELTSVFVALCRAARIPARCVWIPNHCYPEFYLEDDQGEGHWFPCQVAGTRNFGNMPEYLPILQKGDRFVVPERKGDVMRYIQDYVRSEHNLGRKDPRVEFVRQLLGDAAKLRSPDLGGAANPSSAQTDPPSVDGKGRGQN